MAFCSNCGNELAPGAKFCSECGMPVDATSQANNRRRTIYDGVIHKCPNCGETLSSFMVACPACGYELRDIKTTNSIKKFASKIEQADSEEQKANLIRNFPVPNTKEDTFEFMILASSNITGEYNEAVFNAWLAKFEQCYKKASLSFGTDSDFSKIQILYEQTVKKVNKEKVAHGANKVGNAISKFTATFPNPIFGIIVVLLMIYEVRRIANGFFSALDIIMVALILWPVYKITDKKGKKK
ncbi:MAG: zinc ribbon domain-containing protein [Clostridiales bacterium]|nr:zinc ribbon domain-containing protein [Clostridiales bacterium]